MAVTTPKVIRIRGIFEFYAVSESEEAAEKGAYVKIPGTQSIESNSFVDEGEFLRSDHEAIDLLIELNKKMIEYRKQETRNKKVLIESY